MGVEDNAESADDVVSPEALAILPADAPLGHEAWTKVRYVKGPPGVESRGSVQFQCNSIRCQTTEVACGSAGNAKRLARSLYTMLEQGHSKEDILQVRKDVYEQLKAVGVALPENRGKGAGRDTPIAGASPAPIAGASPAPIAGASPAPIAGVSPAPAAVVVKAEPGSGLPDAPPDSDAWTKVRLQTWDGNWRFQAPCVEKYNFSVSLKRCGGNEEEAGRIARLCYVKFVDGVGRDEIREFRDLLYAQVADPGGATPNSAAKVEPKIEESSAPIVKQEVGVKPPAWEKVGGEEDGNAECYRAIFEEPDAPMTVLSNVHPAEACEQINAVRICSLFFSKLLPSDDDGLREKLEKIGEVEPSGKVKDEAPNKSAKQEKQEARDARKDAKKEKKEKKSKRRKAESDSNAEKGPDDNGEGADKKKSKRRKAESDSDAEKGADSNAKGVKKKEEASDERKEAKKEKKKNKEAKKEAKKEKKEETSYAENGADDNAKAEAKEDSGSGRTSEKYIRVEADRCRFTFHNGKEQIFMQISTKKAGGVVAEAERIARLCYDHLEAGDSKEVVTAYRDELYKQAATAAKGEKRAAEGGTGGGKKAKRSNDLVERLKSEGRLEGALRLEGRDEAKNAASINGVYARVPDGFDNHRAYEKADGSKQRFLFFSRKRAGWKVSDSLDDKKPGFAWAADLGEKSPGDSVGLAWQVFSGKDQGYPEDAQVRCLRLPDAPASPQAVAENQEEEAKQVAKASSSGSSSDSDAKEEPEAKGSSSDSDDSSSSSESSGDSGSGAAPAPLQPSPPALPSGSPLQEAPRELQAHVGSLPLKAPRSAGRVCAKMLSRTGLRCWCHFAYAADCPALRRNGSVQ